MILWGHFAIYRYVETQYEFTSLDLTFCFKCTFSNVSVCICVVIEVFSVY